MNQIRERGKKMFGKHRFSTDFNNYFCLDYYLFLPGLISSSLSQFPPLGQEIISLLITAGKAQS